MRLDDAPKDIAETFNSHFASVGENSSEIPPFSVEPDAYVVPDKITFSVKMQAAVLDKIPCKL